MEIDYPRVLSDLVDAYGYRRDVFVKLFFVSQPTFRVSVPAWRTNETEAPRDQATPIIAHKRNCRLFQALKKTQRAFLRMKMVPGACFKLSTRCISVRLSSPSVIARLNLFSHV